METYFDPMRGWVCPEDDYVSETYGSLKEIMKVLNKLESSGVNAPDDLYNAVEQLLYKYQDFVRVGVREKIGAHNGVSWYLNDKLDLTDRCLISYQDGIHADWAHGCFADEVPLWLLLGLFRRIKLRKPLGDQVADETIAAVDKLDTAYVSEKERREYDDSRARQLNITRGVDE